MTREPELDARTRPDAGGEQLDLLFDAGDPRSAAPARRTAGKAARSAGAFLLGWLPTFALAAAFAQVALLGLEPARVESRRLATQEEIVRERELRLLEEHDLLLRQREALADPVFHERVARARRSESFDAPPRPLDLALSPSLEADP